MKYKYFKVSFMRKWLTVNGSTEKYFLLCNLLIRNVRKTVLINLSDMICTVFSF
jgi:hypothetical protein